MNKTERIASYLADGLTPAKVAEIVGCTPALISQLQKDERFAVLLQEKKLEADARPKTEDDIITQKYDVLEHKLINRMDAAADLAELPALTAALRVVAERQERRASRLAAPKETDRNKVVVNISLPAHAAPEIQLNSQNEVIAIGNRTLASMSSIGVKQLFDNIKAQKDAITIEADF